MQEKVKDPVPLVPTAKNSIFIFFKEKNENLFCLFHFIQTERKNIYVGGINKQTTKQELVERFRRFGKIEKTTLHFREKG